MEGKWFDLCSLEKSEKSVVDQISQCSSVVKNSKNSYDILLTVKHCHHFQNLYLYTFKGEGGSEKVYGLYACENDDNYG